MIRDMEETDIAELSGEAENPEETAGYFEKQAGHIRSGMCTGLIAFCQGQMAGYVYLYYRCKWGGLGNRGYPGIVDLYVPERFRRRGIGGRLMDIAERIAADYSDKVYLDVGLNSTFGSAHRLYAGRGYIPDGRGCYYEEKVCGVNEPCINSDELTLCLVKEIEKNIEAIIIEKLDSHFQKAALEFVSFLRENELKFLRDRGYWRDKIYFQVQYQEDCVCYIAMKDPDEKGISWTVWSDNMAPVSLTDNELEDELKQTAWEHVDFCGNCGSCGGGRKKTIFGKEFDRVCGCTFRFDDPGTKELAFMKKMVELKKKELCGKKLREFHKRQLTDPGKA